ncbi:UDP-2,3-diacylglucosamine diphosphatase [Vicingus serpentipes]|uniref:UDP-2,3-diacylglucosamine diphosphatase n=1 Tax=Vicingus serpentipes TaxID=1926625 RepID=A0A5C6RXL1_9FLAO|nr:UDP-2,3-diacylglucosamine diphosphatase [Vicingus serpentipes]TXB67051.1 UDP-2,3-diacylglucosamine diphosphatase [Vicingus serpentipes]
MPEKTKIYFASDFHLGAPNYEKSLEREKLIVTWLDEIKHNAKEIFLVGDLFDFWFEYKHTIPKGFVRLQGKIAELTDSGIPITLFTGNHDMWMFDYLPKELGVTLHRGNITREFNGKKFLIGHGDGLGPGDHGYKFIKKVFANKLCQWAFERIHPNFGLGIGNYWSSKSRKVNAGSDEIFLGEENEWLAIYCREYLQKEHIDYFVFGHRHLPLEIKLNENSTYFNLGEWINYNSFAVFDGEKLEIKTYK